MKRNPIFVYNNIDQQKLVYANQLTVKQWNDIINKLTAQANANTTFLETWTRWFFGPIEYTTEDEYTDSLGTYDSYYDYLKAEFNRIDTRITNEAIRLDGRINEEKANREAKDAILSNRIDQHEIVVENLSQDVNNRFATVNETLNKKINKDFSGLSVASSVHKEDTVIVRCAGCDGNEPVTYTLTVGALTELINSEVNYFKGYHSSFVALQAAHPTGEPGDYAFVATENDDQYHMYVWDEKQTPGRWEETISGQYALASSFAEFQQRLADGSAHVGAIKGNVSNASETDPLLVNIEINGNKYILPSIALDFLGSAVEGAYKLGAIKINGDTWNVNNDIVTFEMSDENVEGAYELGSMNINGNIWNVAKLSFVEEKIAELKAYLEANSFNKGEFLSLEKLQEKHPDAKPGEFAFVNTPTDQGDVMLMYVWDEDANTWRETTSQQYVLTSVFETFKASVEEKLKNAGGVMGVEKLPNASIGTAVPNDGSTVEKIYFNKNKSYEEWVSILSSLSYPVVNSVSGIESTYIMLNATENPDKILGVEKTISTEKYSVTYFDSAKQITIFSTDAGGVLVDAPEYIDYNAPSVYVGEFMNKNNSILLADFISCEPFKETPDEINDKVIYRIKSNNPAVPNSGTVQKIYFNTDLTVAEVVSWLKKVTFVMTPLLSFPVYPIICASDSSPVVIAVYNESIDYYEITAVTDIANQTAKSIFATGLSGEVGGWKISEFEINKEVVSDYSGISIGTENEKITGLVSVTPFTSTRYYNNDGEKNNRLLTEKDSEGFEKTVFNVTAPTFTKDDIRSSLGSLKLTTMDFEKLVKNKNACIIMSFTDNAFAQLYSGSTFNLNTAIKYDGNNYSAVFSFVNCEVVYEYWIISLKCSSGIYIYDCYRFDVPFESGGGDETRTLQGVKNNLQSQIDNKQDKLTIDTEMSDTSTNLVQNKVIKAYIDSQISGSITTALEEDY